MARIDYDERIPNNVNLSSDARLQRALEAWQPAFVDWWKEMGPVGHQADRHHAGKSGSRDSRLDLGHRHQS